MKNEITLIELDQVTEALQKSGFNCSPIKNGQHSKAVKLLYTCNTDGTVRWVWPRQNNHADMLRFYHTKGWKASLFSMMTKTLFMVRLQGMFFKTINLFVEGKQNTRWALFTGTVGPNRKMVLWNKEESGKAFFTKIALTEQAATNLSREAEGIQLFHEMAKHQAQAPEVLLTNNELLRLNDISYGTKKTNLAASLPTSSLQQWLKPNSYYPIHQLTWWKNVEELIGGNAPMKNKKIAPSIIAKLGVLFNQVNAAAVVAMAPQHGDFTPWNVWNKNGRLCMIDWELFEKEGTALFDLFHFVYQSNILIGNKGYQAIRKQLDELFDKTEWKAFVHEHKLDVQLLEQLYLLRNITYHLELYSKQSNWHMQVEWLLQTWNEALTYFIETTDQRKAVLQDISVLLHNQPYAAMKFTDTSFEDVSAYSDIDICIAPKHALELEASLKKHVFVKKLKMTKFSNMQQLAIQLKDHSMVHIDCIFQFKRKSILFLDEQQVLTNAQQNNAGIKVASIEHDFTYMWLFHWLNGSGISDKYQNFFSNQTSETHKRLNAYLQQHWNVANFTCLFIKEEKVTALIKQQVLAMPANNGFQAFKNKIWYAMDIIKRLFPHKGFIVTFSGVDGAGKSTVIQSMKYRLEKKYRKRVVVLRHRPSLLPILSAWQHGKQAAELKAANTLPRQGNNNNTLSSAIRFAYYYTDYLLGQLYVQLRYVMMGYVVLYDRYYFDFINDSKRSNINLSKKFTSSLYSLLMKPKFNFFLYAKAEEILERKKELDEATINQLTNQYMDLFKQLNSKYKHSSYLPLYNCNLNTTLDTIESTIKS